MMHSWGIKTVVMSSSTLGKGTNTLVCVGSRCTGELLIFLLNLLISAVNLFLKIVDLKRFSKLSHFFIWLKNLQIIKFFLENILFVYHLRISNPFSLLLSHLSLNIQHLFWSLVEKCWKTKPFVRSLVFCCKYFS